MALGALRETLVIQVNTPLALPLISLTRSSTTATATTVTAHGYVSGDYVRLAGASPTGYNGVARILVTGTTTFTFPTLGTLTTPATGTITVMYVSDAQGGRKIGWTTLMGAPNGIWAQLIPVRAWERLQSQALQAQLDYRFRVRVRTDITAQMRAQWRPSWPPTSTTHTLEIHGVIPEGDGRTFMLIDVGELS